MNDSLLILLLVFGGHSLVAAFTDEDIREVSSLAWNVDYQRFRPDQLHYNIHGPELFDFVYENKLISGGTYARFIKLFDNYEPRTGMPDPYVPNRREEEYNWLNQVVKSEPMKEVWYFLRHNGLAPMLPHEFEQELWNMWFKPYSRSNGAYLDSSGFEHTFLGEIRNNAVTGFHNWVFAHKQEEQGNFQLGSSTRRCPNRAEAFSFTWLGYSKSLSSIMMGASPELELAIYTLCFKTKANRSCPVHLGGYDMSVTTYDFQQQPVIGSAYFNC